MKDLLKELTELSAPSGNEKILRTHIRKLIKPYIDEFRIDALGNLIARKGNASSTGRRIMVAAHMDENGVIASHIDEHGFVRFSLLGNLFSKHLPGNQVRFMNGVEGVIGTDDQQTETASNDVKRMFIDVGANRRKECRVEVGDVAAFVRPFEQVGDKLIGKALDNRAGIAVLIETIQTLKNTPHEIYFVFTVQEELGTRGAGPAAHRLDPELGIVIDVTRAEDIPNISQQTAVLGKGPAIKIKDQSTLCDPRIVEWMIKAAEKAQLPFQREVRSLGGSDLEAMQFSRTGMPVGGISIPCRYLGTLSEMVDLDDLNFAVKLLKILLSKPLVLD
jgi:endoglucanase